MANNSPTIVAASMDDEKLKKSIEQMVQNLNDGLEKMKKSTDSAVEYMQKSLQKLGNVKVDSGGAADGGSSKRAKHQNEETDAVQKTTAARKEYNATLDQTAQAMQKAAGGSKMSVIETYDMQIELLKNRLREVRQDIDIFNTAIGSGKKTQVEWGQQGLKQAREEAELLMRQITALESKRGGIQSILAPQGDTIKNFVQSLQKANPELALLNQQYKEGNALLQQRNTSVRNSAEEERRLAAERADGVRKEIAFAATTTQRERERQMEMIRSAQAAQTLSRELIRNMSLGSADISTNNYDKLTSYLRQMQQLYYNIMSVSERESPVGRALKNDIEIVEKARLAIVNYAQASKKILSAESESNTGGNLNLEKLRSKIRELTAEYEKLTVAEINAGKDKGIVENFQRISRAAQILQKNLSTPISFNAVNKIQVRTLDDMVYKMQQLNAYRHSIDLTKPDADRKIREVDAAIVQLKKDMDKYMASTKAADNATNALTRSLNYMKNRLAFYFTVGASTAFVNNLIDIRAQYEMNERALGILINSAERGSQIFKELSDMALVSPYTLIELSSAAKQLTAYDIAAKDVVDKTRRLADMTAAVGIPIERLTYAIGQVKAYGYLNARDARMFANAGIPLVKELADYYTQLEGHLVSTADVYDKIKKKAIDYNAVMSVVTKMTDEGGKFFDFQAKMAGTLKVQLANLTLAWNNMLNEIGSDSQGMLSTAIGGLKELFLIWKDLDKIIKSVLWAFGLWKAAQLTALAVTGNLTGAMAAQVVMGTKLQAKFASMAAGMKSASIGISAAGMAFWLAIGDAIMTYRRNAEEIEQLNKSIADGAKESAESLSKFLEGTEIYQNRLSAATGNLPKAEAEKTWEALKEQIELTADSSDEIIAKLLDPKKYDNINDRLTAGFEILDSIKNVTSKIGDAFDKLDVSQDTILFGAFGEGLAEDIDDYNERIKYTTEVAEWAAKKNKGLWDNAVMGLKALFSTVKEDLGSSEGEAQEEIRNFASHAAQTIKDELGEEGLSDKIQINEAIARVIQGMEKQFQQIKGKGKALFETIFYDVMSTEFEGAVDKQTYYYNMFLNRLKKDHASAFQDVTDGILEDTHTWNSAQLDAIKKTADRVKEDLPAASQDAINQILGQLNNTEFKLRIVTQFATTTQDEVNKQFKDAFINKPFIEDNKERERQETEALQKYGTLMKKTEESNLEYQDRVRKKREENLKISEDNAKIIDANKNKTDAASRAIVENAKEEKKAADDFLESAKKVEDWGGYDFSTKNENKAASKAQATAEKEVTEAFKNELSVLKEMQSAYDKMRKAGVDNTTAIDLASRGYEQTLKRVNATLAKYGISKFNASDFLGKDVNAVLRKLEQQRADALASGKLKSSELKELDVEISKLNVDAKTYNMDKITKGLNSELDKLKDEYELALDLDANPELGDVFADMMGLDKEQLAELPRDFEGVMSKLQRIIDDKLGKGVFNLRENLNKASFESWLSSQGTDLDNERAKILNSYIDYANKVRQDETKKQVDEWNKLLEKYAEYEYKRKMIAEEAAREMEIARKKGAGQDILDAIERKRSEMTAQTYFEEFQKSPMWITATGNLAGMTDSALKLLADDIERFKNSSKGLSAKNIKDINKALISISKEQKKNNPFKSLAISAMNAKERMATFDEEISETEKKLDDLYNKQNQSNLSETGSQIAELVEKLRKLKDAREKAGEIDATEFVAGINSMIQVTSQAVSMFTEMANALSGDKWNEGIEVLNDVMSTVEKAGQGAAIGAQVGGGWGAIIGGVAGGLIGAITAFADNANKKIDSKIKDSEVAVKRLEAAYVDLQHAMDEAYGTGIAGSKRLSASMKELELAELERQLALEQSRDSKHRDEGAVADLQKQIKELRYEIEDTITEITDELLGGEAGSFAEDLVSSMIDAFKKGEDYMQVFEDKFDEMIDNMIMKSITSRVVAQYIDKIWDNMDARIAARSYNESEELAMATKRRQELESMDIYAYAMERHGIGKYGIDTIEDTRKIMEEMYEIELAAAKEAEKTAQAAYDAVSGMDDSDISALISELAEIKPELGNRLREILGEYYKFGETSNKELSALQQGLQSMSESTANALEAYANSISQQAYLRNDLLVQIRDTIMSFDMDVQLSVFSQMLLQLQNNYIIMQSMQSMMEGWTTPSGQGIRVELIS